MGIRDKVASISDISYEQIDVPEWGLKLWVRGLTGSERDRYEQLALGETRGGQDPSKAQVHRAELVQMATLDHEGDEPPDANAPRAFRPADIAMLQERSSLPLTRLASAILRLSGFGTDAKSAAEQRLGETAAGDSGSDSPAI